MIEKFELSPVTDMFEEDYEGEPAFAFDAAVARLCLYATINKINEIVDVVNRIETRTRMLTLRGK